MVNKDEYIVTYLHLRNILRPTLHWYRLLWICCTQLIFQQIHQQQIELMEPEPYRRCVPLVSK